jgi:hypothetical protein
MEVEKDGNVYTADYTLVDGENSFYIQAIAKDGITTKQYILTMVYDVPDAPAVRLDDTVADELKAGGVVTNVYVTAVDDASVYTYELCEGNGDTHNDYFEIVNGVAGEVTIGGIAQIDFDVGDVIGDPDESFRGNGRCHGEASFR